MDARIEPDASVEEPTGDKFWFRCPDGDAPLPVTDVKTKETGKGMKQTKIILDCPEHGTHWRKFDWENIPR